MTAVALDGNETGPDWTGPYSADPVHLLIKMQVGSCNFRIGVEWSGVAGTKQQQKR